MIAELGFLCLVLALLMSAVQATTPLIQRLIRPHPTLPLAKLAATATLMLVTGAFAALIDAFATSDFSLLTVIENSHSRKPLLYKIVGAWGNHEGSMLLWMWVLAACGFLVALIKAHDRELKAATLALLGLMNAGFLAFIIFTSNPFTRVFPAPLDGEDLNPILQDIGLAFHPPTLYVGYVGFGVVFAYAVSGMLLKRMNSDWARTVQPWILLPWTFLTLGIAAGSWWAYRELGWGGWWFWDPVENVSLLPWLVGTALIHSNRVLERRGQLARWVALLAILAFTLSLIGTFIVRSGLITSVHSFASDPARGLFILAYIVAVSGGALLVYGFWDPYRKPPYRTPYSGIPLPLRERLGEGALLDSTSPCTPLTQPSPARGEGFPRPVALPSRSGFILINNLLLVVAAAVVLVAILYPLALELLSLPGISIGPRYFEQSFMPLMLPLPILAALAPLMAWDKTTPEQLKQLGYRLAPAALVGIVIALALSPASALMLVGLPMAAWLAYGSAQYLKRVRGAKIRVLSNTGLRHLGIALAHLGFAIFILGMTLTASLKQTYDAKITANAPMVMGNYTLKLVAADKTEEHNYSRRRAVVEVSRAGHVIATLAPELRYYPLRNMQTSEAALHSTLFQDIYLVLGETTYREQNETASLGLRMYVTPGQQFVWLGFVLAALGGGLAMLTSLTRGTPHKGDA